MKPVFINLMSKNRLYNHRTFLRIRQPVYYFGYTEEGLPAAAPPFKTYRVLYHDALLQHDIRIQRLLTRRNDRVDLLRLLIECEAFDLSDCGRAARCPTYVSSGNTVRIASSSSGTPWPSQRITIASFPIDSAGKLPSEMTRRSLCPISQRTFKSSGDRICGIPFSIIIFSCRFRD